MTRGWTTPQPSVVHPTSRRVVVPDWRRHRWRGQNPPPCHGGKDAAATRRHDPAARPRRPAGWDGWTPPPPGFVFVPAGRMTAPAIVPWKTGNHRRRTPGRSRPMSASRRTDAARPENQKKPPPGKKRVPRLDRKPGRLNMGGGKAGRPWRSAGKPRRCIAGGERGPSPWRSDKNPRPVSSGGKTRPPARPGTRNVRRSRRARWSLAVESSGGE